MGGVGSPLRLRRCPRPGSGFLLWAGAGCRDRSVILPSLPPCPLLRGGGFKRLRRFAALFDYPLRRGGPFRRCAPPPPRGRLTGARIPRRCGGAPLSQRGVKGNKVAALRAAFYYPLRRGTLSALRATSPEGEADGRVWNPPLHCNLRRGG